MADRSTIVISDGVVKRCLPPTPFAVSGSPDALERLAEQLLSAARELRAAGSPYGWVTLPEPILGPINTPPLGWRDRDR